MATSRSASVNAWRANRSAMCRRTNVSPRRR
jgi:hypothetical protein